MGFYIEQLRVWGKEKPPTTIKFAKGLNIICGVSDAGKTYILKCIKFVFGGKQPFEPAIIGYNAVSLSLVADDGHKIEIKRTIGKKAVEVLSDGGEIVSGEYDVIPNDKKRTKKNRNPLLNELYLSLIGIKNEPKVVTNQYFDRKRFTWKTIMPLFYLEEENVINSLSVLLPSIPSNKVYLYSSLLYLITGNSYEDAQTQEKEQVGKIRKNAVSAFVKEHLIRMEEQEGVLEENIKCSPQYNPETDLKLHQNQLMELEQKMASIREKMTMLSEEIAAYNAEVLEKKIQCERLADLKLQYLADIKRLNFIVDGIQKGDDGEKIHECPVCKNMVVKKPDGDYLKVAKAEIIRITSLLKGLLLVEKELCKDIELKNEAIASKEADVDKIKNLISNIYTVQAKEHEASIAEIVKYISLKEQLSLLQEHIVLIKKEFEDYASEVDGEDQELRFKPLNLYPVDFNRKMNELLADVLESCQYDELKTVAFDMQSFDVCINGYQKKDTHGKGHWAYINTCLLLALRQYFCREAVYNPGILLIDSPLLGLDEGENIIPESMKYGLFSYLINTRNDGQMIIIENTSNVPDLDYNKDNISVLEFTKDKYTSKYNSQYGFLNL